jgi:HemY protein
MPVPCLVLIVEAVLADRTRAALLAASAASFEVDPQERLRAQALDFAVQAAKLKPDFAPGVVMAARLLAADGKVGKAAGLIEGAWKGRPHPALWLAYRDLRTDETPRERAKRLASLVALNADARESRILKVEQALIAGEVSVAREAARTLEAEPLTQRLAGLQARARILGFADTGSDRTLALTGTVRAAQLAISRAHLQAADIDLFEINEGFAAMALHFMEDMKVDHDRVNVNGGAIAIGHAMGCTGAALVSVLLDELDRRELRYGCIAICGAAGVASALVLERLSNVGVYP